MMLQILSSLNLVLKIERNINPCLLDLSEAGTCSHVPAASLEKVKYQASTVRLGDLSSLPMEESLGRGQGKSHTGWGAGRHMGAQRGRPQYAGSRVEHWLSMWASVNSHVGSGPGGPAGR